MQASVAAAGEKINYADLDRLIYEGKFDESEELLKKYIAEDNADVAAVTLLGEVYRQKGDRRQALKMLRKAISIDPKYPPAYLYLGKLYFSMQKFNEGKEEFNQFIDNMRPIFEDGSNKEFYLHGLHDISVAYADIKFYDEQRKALDEILIISPQDQTAIYNLGVYYYKHENNRSKAYHYFNKTIEIGTDSHLSKKAKYAIEFIRANPDARVVPDFSFVDQEYRD